MLDWVVVGSGFGGSVSALRLTEKGYDVEVLEAGRRFADTDLPKSTWDVQNYFFRPRLGLKGIFRITIFKDVTILSGAGVGGGSLGYANTLYVPPPPFFRDPQWAELADWESELAPHYDEAQRMLGVVEYDQDDPAADLLREFGDSVGAGDTYSRTRVGVFLGEPGKTVPDPFFGGAGPARTGCLRCGRCMVGCPHGAKNTLVKNYLWLAERGGARVTSERTVVDIRPIGPPDGSEGWEIVHERTGAWLVKDRRVTRARGVVLAAGALGTNGLLATARASGSLKRLSPRLGDLVRTNSEMILAVTAPDDGVDYARRIAITSSVYPDPHTHIETVTYGDAGGAIKGLYTLLVGDGSRVTRPLKLLGGILRKPKLAWKLTFARNWSRRTIILLVMQTLDNSMSLRPRRKLFGGVRLQTEQDPDNPNPTFIPVANQAAEWFAERTGGIPQSSVTEALANIPTTAHILGGAIIGGDPEHGVIDSDQRVFGYENLLVCDGAAVPANVGVNPSLTITALAERAVSRIPPKGQADAADSAAASAASTSGAQ